METSADTPENIHGYQLARQNETSRTISWQLFESVRLISDGTGSGESGEACTTFRPTVERLA